MKRVLRIVMFVTGILFTATGCLNEKYDHCLLEQPQPEITLQFRLSDGNGGCKFRSSISVVDLAVYNQQGECVYTQCLSSDQLARYQGARLDLPPGTYQVVAWGNIIENTMHEAIQGNWHEYAPQVKYSHIEEDKVVNSDKVHYAPLTGKLKQSEAATESFTMVVDPLTGYSGVLEFIEAYKTVHIFIEGYYGVPNVQLHDLPGGLTWFGMNQLNDPANPSPHVIASQKSSAIEIDRVQYDYATFDTFSFDRDNNIRIRILDTKADKTDFDLSLNEAVDNPALLDEIEINVLIRFTPNGVEVSVPTWDEEQVTPGFNP